MTSTSDGERTENGRGASVIVNVLRIIRCFTVEQPQQGVTEIAEKVGLHKSSVSRILATLEQERVVQRDEETRRYRLGLGLIAVAGPLLAELDVRRVALEDLTELAELTGETSALAVWNGEAAVTVEQVPSRHQIKHTSVLGSHYRTALSSTVQVLLAALDPAEAEQLVSSGTIRLEQGWTVAEYLDRLAEVRAQGHALNDRATSEDEVSLAAPVQDHRGEVVAAVLLAAPFYRAGAEQLPELAARTRAAADAISRRLGAARRG
jgi:DNA-binding IclR family transcriptional regulator